VDNTSKSRFLLASHRNFLLGEKCEDSFPLEKNHMK